MLNLFKRRTYQETEKETAWRKEHPVLYVLVSIVRSPIVIIFIAQILLVIMIINFLKAIW